MTTETLQPVNLTGDGRDLLTFSRMQTFKTCPRKHYFAYEIGLRPSRAAQPLRLGAAIHAGIDAHHRGMSTDDAIALAAAEYQEFPAWCTSDEAIDDWLVEAETVRRLLAGYFWRWQGETVETIESEHAFSVPIVNPETGAQTNVFRHGGKMDRIVRLSDGRLAVFETKTTGMDISPESDYWRRLSIDSQISGYMMAARASGRDVETVVYDVIRKPSIRPRKVTKAEAGSLLSTRTWFGESIELAGAVEREMPRMFGARLNADIAERPDFYYARREIPRLDSDLAEHAEELWQTQQAIREAQKRGRWYRNTSACMVPRCQYADLCFGGITVSPGDPAPPGFEIIPFVHPELSNDEGDES